MAILKSILQRLNNKGSILALASLGISLIAQFGIEIDSEKVMGIITTVTTILISLGILNDCSDSTSMYIPGVSDKLVEKQPKVEDIKAEAKVELENAVNVVEEVKAEADEMVKGQE